MTPPGPGSARKSPHKKAPVGTPDKPLRPGGYAPEQAPRRLHLTAVDAVLAALLLMGALFFGLGLDRYIWKELYLPSHQFSRFDPAGGALADRLAARPDSVHRHGGESEVLRVEFTAPRDEAITASGVFSWNIDGAAVKCGAAGRLSAALFVDGESVPIRGGSSSIEGGASAGPDIAFSVLLDKPFAMSYDLSSALTEGVHEVLLLVTVAVAGAPEGGSEEASLLQRWGCGPSSCSALARRTVFFAGTRPPTQPLSERQTERLTERLTDTETETDIEIETVKQPGAQPERQGSVADPLSSANGGTQSSSGAAEGHSGGTGARKYNIFGPAKADPPSAPPQSHGPGEALRGPHRASSGSDGDRYAAEFRDPSGRPLGGFGISAMPHVFVFIPKSGDRVSAPDGQLDLHVYFSEWAIARFEAVAADPHTAEGARCMLTFDDFGRQDVTRLMLLGRVAELEVTHSPVWGGGPNGLGVPVQLALRAVGPGWHRVKLEVLLADGAVGAWDALRVEVLAA